MDRGGEGGAARASLPVTCCPAIIHLLKMKTFPPLLEQRRRRRCIGVELPLRIQGSVAKAAWPPPHRVSLGRDALVVGGF